MSGRSRPAVTDGESRDAGGRADRLPMGDHVAELRALVGHRPLVMVGSSVLARDAGGRLLLVERADTGDWGLPGGYLEPGESTEECGHRELFEETGIAVTGLSLFGVFSGGQARFLRYPNGDQVHSVTVAYTARAVSERPTVDPIEVRQAAFFPIDRLPEPLFGVERPILERYRAAVSGPA